MFFSSCLSVFVFRKGLGPNTDLAQVKEADNIKELYFKTKEKLKALRTDRKGKDAEYKDIMKKYKELDNLKKESKAQAEIAAQKERARASAMNLDLEDNKVNSVTEEVNRKILDLPIQLRKLNHQQLRLL